MPWHDWLLIAVTVLCYLAAVTFICLWLWAASERRRPSPPRKWVDDRTEQRDVDGWLR